MQGLITKYNILLNYWSILKNNEMIFHKYKKVLKYYFKYDSIKLSIENVFKKMEEDRHG
jgi:hypothetical protein